MSRIASDCGPINRSSSNPKAPGSSERRSVRLGWQYGIGRGDHLASLTSFDSDGLTVNYTAVQGMAKKGFMLYIQ